MSAISIVEQIRAKFDTIKADSRFAAAEWWLTFYLCGDRVRLEEIARTLLQLGGKNLGGPEYGFFYPKVPVRSELTAMIAVVERVIECCEEVGVEIDHIDADTSSDVEHSSFRCLYKS